MARTSLLEWEDDGELPGTSESGTGHARRRLTRQVAQAAKQTRAFMLLLPEFQPFLLPTSPFED
jgi:hypothetical protein